MPMFVKETMPFEKRKVESQGTTHGAGSGEKVPWGEIRCAGETQESKTIYTCASFFHVGKQCRSMKCQVNLVLSLLLQVHLCIYMCVRTYVYFSLVCIPL